MWREVTTPARRKECVKKHIQDQLSLCRCHRYLSSALYANEQHRALYLERQTQAKAFSALVAQTIKSGDWDFLLENLNREQYRFIRDRGDWQDFFCAKFCVEVRFCEDCGHIDHADDMSWAYNDHCICESCRDRNYIYSDSRDTYVSEDDADEDEDEDCHDCDDPDGLINDYHRSEVGHIPSEFDQRKNPIFLGLELEVEIGHDYSRGDKAGEVLDALYKHKGHKYCALENDGSLSHGFEIVTGYTGLDVHREQLRFFENHWHGVRSHDTKTCGLHVHICKRGVTMYHAAKMILFINDSQNQRLVRAVARRDSSGYAKIANKKASYDWLKRAKAAKDPLSHLNDDRYEALNFQNPKTIEFRLFKGTLKYSTIMACLEFTYATWQFTQAAGIQDLTTPKFIEFICKPENKADTIHLRQYLLSKNFELPKAGHLKLVKDSQPDEQFEQAA